jgi:hypothetical protein
MRIPVYTSRAQPEKTTPGSLRRNTVRMNGSLLAEAELQKAKPLQALLDGASKFATMRYEASQEAQYNQSALAIEEGMREAEYALSNSSDIYNVLDGKNKWNDYMTDLRDKTIESVDNRNMRRKLSYAFEQNEIAARFRLRATLDEKILAAEQAAMAARMEALKQELSVPGKGTTVENYISKLSIINNDQAKAVKGGRYSPEGVKNANRKLKMDIASGYIANVYGNDPNKAMQLFNMMSLQDEVAAGTMTEEDAMKKAGITDEYALHVLYSLDRVNAVKVIQDNLAMSLKFFDAEEKLEADQLEETNKRNTKAYNYATSLVLGGEPVSSQRLQSLMGSAYDNLPDVYKIEELPAVTAKTILRNFLVDQEMWTTPAQRELLDKQLDEDTSFAFASPGQGNDLYYSQLYALAERGMLTVEELDKDKYKITLSQYNSLNTKIFNEADESLNVGSKILKRAFKYNELDAQTDNPTLARASKSAFENADGALLEEFSRREAEGNPMTLAEVRAFAKEQIDLFGESYRDELRLELEEYIKDATIPALGGGVVIDPADPINSIEIWWESLNKTQQKDKSSAYRTQKRVIRSRFANQGLGF